MTKKDWTKRWKKVSGWWGKLNPPWTPSLEEYKIYDSYLRRVTNLKHKGRSLLILGATALLRELGEKYGYKITLIDINPEMIKSQTKFLGHKPKNEKVIIGDWLKTDKLLRGQKFDIISGDHSIINVKFKEWPKLYRNLAKLLKPTGFIFWGVTVCVHKKYSSIQELAEDYQPTSSDIDRFLRIYRLFGNPRFHDQNFGFHFGKINQKIAEVAKNHLAPDEIRNLQLTELPSDWVSVILPQKKFEQFTEKYFKIVDKKYDKSHPFYRYQQLYLLKKK